MNKIIQGDALEVLKTLENESIDCVITSPPYWALRDYGVEGQLGLEPTFQEYITKLCDIFDEVKRVLKKEGTCWVVIGDTYYGSGKGVGGDIKKSKESYQMPEDWKRPSRDNFNKIKVECVCLFCKQKFKGKPKSQFCSTTCLNKMGNDFRSQNRQMPDKSLCQIPSRFTIEMTNRGWILRNEIIWHKPNCMPSSVKDRFTVNFEKVFFFVKNKKYWFETQYEKYTAPMNRWGGDKLKADGKSNWDNGTGQDTYRDRNMRPNEEGRNKRTVWTITTKPFKEAHFAVFPEALIEPMIKAGCPVNGIVLDCFFGAGTTGVVSLKLDRKYLGIELNPEYIKIAQDRIKPYENKLF